MKKKFGGKVMWAGVALVAVGSLIPLRYLYTKRMMDKVQQALDRSMPALAFDRIESMQHDLISSDRGCKLLVDTFSAARRADRLQWAAEACIDRGIKTEPVLLGLATSYEASGREDDAIQFLQQAVQEQKNSGVLFTKLALLARKKGLNQVALDAFAKAVDKSPDNALLSLSALQFYSEMGKDDLAIKLADKLKTVKTDSPEVKFILARAFKKGRELASAKQVMQEGEQMMASADAKFKEQVRAKYKDLFMDKELMK